MKKGTKLRCGLEPRNGIKFFECRSERIRQAPDVSFRSREDLVLENLALRRQLLALHAQRPRTRLTALHKLFWVALRTFWSGWRKPLVLGYSGASRRRRRPTLQPSPFASRRARLSPRQLALGSNNDTREMASQLMTGETRSIAGHCWNHRATASHGGAENLDEPRH